MGSADSTDYAVGPLPPDGNQNRGGQIIAVEAVFFGISWSMVLLRTVTRMWITRNFGWDDATTLVAATTNSIGMGFYVTMISYGLGRHKYYLSNYDYKEFLKYDYLMWMQTVITLAISKISICLFLLRLSKFNKLKTVLWGLFGLLVITHLPLTILLLAQCDPISREWDMSFSGRCFSKHMVENILIAQGVFSILTDFIGAAFPVVLLWNVKIKIQDKMALWLLMGLGIITGIACMVRTSLTYHITKDDLPWFGVGIAMAKVVEVNFGIIAACLPLMKPLYTFIRSGQTRPRVPNNTKPPSTGKHTPWRKLQSSRTDTDGKPQWTWRKPLPNMPDGTANEGKGHETQDTSHSIGLPLQGIRKTTDFGFERFKAGTESGIAMEELV